MHCAFSQCPSVCQSVCTLVWLKGYGESRTSFSRNTTVPAFHCSASHWSTNTVSLSSQDRYTLDRTNIYSEKCLFNVTLWSGVCLSNGFYCHCEDKCIKETWHILKERLALWWSYVSKASRYLWAIPHRVRTVVLCKIKNKSAGWACRIQYQGAVEALVILEVDPHYKLYKKTKNSTYAASDLTR